MWHACVCVRATKASTHKHIHMTRFCHVRYTRIKLCFPSRKSSLSSNRSASLKDAVRAMCLRHGLLDPGWQVLMDPGNLNSVLFPTPDLHLALLALLSHTRTHVQEGDPDIQLLRSYMSFFYLLLNYNFSTGSICSCIFGSLCS